MAVPDVPGIQPWWQRVGSRQPTGPVDWWLACLSVVLLFLGSALIAPPIGVLGSFLVSRAALATAGGGRSLGPRKWLVYPSLILTYLPLLALLFWWPLLPLIAHWRPAVRLSAPQAYLLFALPLWWLVLAALLHRFPRFFAAVFRPFVRPGFGFAVWVALAALLTLYLFTWPLFVRLGPVRVVTPVQSSRIASADL